MSDMRTNSRFGKGAVGITLLVTLSLFTMARTAFAGVLGDTFIQDELPRPMASLKTAVVPMPPNLADFIKDRDAAIALGKALFWDMQAGSDGIQACASCHFHAGADDRSQNQVNPGGDGAFSLKRPNGKLTSANYPVHKLADPDNRFSEVLSDSNDIVGSQGVFDSIFIDITPGVAQDRVAYKSDPTFNVNGITTRRVTGRNTPTNINAIFNYRAFWDGRAQNEFNGVNPFGSRDANAYVLMAVKPSVVQKTKVLIPNAALASQAVGPALSPFEMSGDGRIFQKMARKLGKKMQQLDVLAKQQVSLDDSVLGKLSKYPKTGITSSYRKMIQDAFQPQWWNANVVITIDANGEPVITNSASSALSTDQYTLMEYNFALFWGLAIQMYESTLISDNSRFDQYMDGIVDALTIEEQLGMMIFKDTNRGNCVACHSGAEFTNAAVDNITGRGRLETMQMANNNWAVYDSGFYNIGVRPTEEDRGLGGNDPWGKPLSDTRMSQLGLFIDPAFGVPISPTSQAVAEGTFKVPSLRNIELTAPYFHNGGQATLRQVVEFYNRGGDFHEHNIDNLDPDIKPLALAEWEKVALVAFLKTLTDERVRLNAAPFDHPQLFIPNGHPGDELSTVDNGNGNGIAMDQLREIPMSGRTGYATPPPNFLD
jgi:cytochrome c peroxidase